jgi:hypothetical protein
MSDPLMELLAHLRSAELDRARAEAIRARCHARLARRASRGSASRPDGEGITTVRLWQPFVAILGAAYITEVIIQAIRVYSLP